jgi:hypothetical protein
VTETGLETTARREIQLMQNEIFLYKTQTLNGYWLLVSDVSVLATTLQLDVASRFLQNVGNYPRYGATFQCALSSIRRLLKPEILGTEF